MNHLIEMGQVFARRIVRTAAAFAVLSTVATAASAQQFTIGAYHLQSSVRVSLTQYDYTYTADVSNSGGAAQNVVGTVTSSSPHTVVVKSTVNFGSVPAGGTITSTDTLSSAKIGSIPSTPRACRGPSLPPRRYRRQMRVQTRQPRLAQR